MWLIDRLRRKRAADTPVANEPTLPLGGISGARRSRFPDPLRDARAIPDCRCDASFRGRNLARAELLLADAANRLPKHVGLRENLAAVRAARAGSR